MVDELDQNDLPEKDGDLESVKRSPSDLGTIRIKLTAADPTLAISGSFSEQMAHLRDAWASLAVSLYESMRPPTDVIDTFRTFLKSMGTQIVEANRLAAERMAQLAEQMQAVADKILESTGLEEAHAKEVAPYFKDAELWFSLAMPLSVWTECYQLYLVGQLTPEVVQSQVLDAFRTAEYTPLKTMVSKWWNLPEFKPRKRFIEDALEAHMDGKYTLSVPVLLVAIEGVLKAIFEMPQSDLSHFDKKIQEQISDWRFNSIIAEAFLNAFKVLHGDKRKEDRLNRNKILHGEDWNYNTELNSLRAFLMLDFISAVSRNMHRF